MPRRYSLLHFQGKYILLVASNDISRNMKGANKPLRTVKAKQNVSLKSLWLILIWNRISISYFLIKVFLVLYSIVEMQDQACLFKQTNKTLVIPLACLHKAKMKTFYFDKQVTVSMIDPISYTQSYSDQINAETDYSSP